jgi:hypothetical protein
LNNPNNDVTRLDARDSSRRQGKLNKLFTMATIEIFPGDDYYKTSILRGHQAL